MIVGRFCETPWGLTQTILQWGAILIVWPIGCGLLVERVENSLVARIDSCLPSISTSRLSHLCRSPPNGSIRSLLPSQLYLLCC
jgi:hypothetical protein